MGKVKAGYLCKEKDSYYIYPTVLNGQYYTLSERTLITEYLNLKDKTQWTFPKLLSESHNELQHEAEKFNRVVNINRDGEETISYVGTHNQNFMPHFSKISYTLKGKEITGIEEEGVLERQGCVHFSGWIGKKKAFYVIPQIDKSPKKAVKLDEKEIKSFQVDFAAKEKQLKGLGKRERLPDESQSDFEKGEKQRKDKIAAFFSLPGEGEEKPVFYVQGEKRVYFGFTPHLRVFYDQSIHAGFPKGYQTDKIDYAKALFGYSKGQRTYRSRLSFTDAVLEEHAKYKDYNGKGNQKRYILSSPKPSSYKDYLKPKRGKGVVSYNGDFDLRGLKQYWLHKWAEKSTQVDNEAVATETPALEVQSGGFVGKIRYKNLSEEELGLILWALKLRETSWQNIGKGKPYGFGRIKVQIRQVKRLDCERAYGLEGLEWNPMCDITEETEALIQKYKEMIKERYRVDIDKKAHVKEFFLMKESILPADKIQYMSVQNDYHTNRKVLPSVEELALAKEDTRK